MPATRLGPPAKKYVGVQEFINQYSLSKANAYRILARPEMKEAIFKVGERAIRIEINKAHDIMKQLFN